MPDQILWIDASVRVESRTRALTRHLLSRLRGEVTELRLFETEIPTLHAESLAFRNDACARGDYSDPMFALAHQFAEADTVVITAPYWDNSFPARLKAYIEAVCISGLTFHYTPEGVPQGLCRARRLFYVTTAGGYIQQDAFGFGYVRSLAEGMFGIPHCVCFKAEGLDLFGADVASILADAEREIDGFFRDGGIAE